MKPDVVVNLGDQADMASLSSYDKGTRNFQGRSYAKDIAANAEFNDRWWGPVKRTKKKLPYRVVLEGNHEHRVEKALDLSPELEDTIGFNDYQFDDYYDTVVKYNGGTPGAIELDGILFAHYFITGISGRPIGGEHSAFNHSVKVGQSTVSGHSHLLDYNTRTNISGRTLNNLVAGCFHEYVPDWAGLIGHLWRPGVAVLRNVENGNFDLEWVGIKQLREEYNNS